MTKDAFSKGVISVYCVGDNWRPLVHVKDVADAHIHAMNAPEDQVKGQIYNLVHKNYMIKGLGQEVGSILKQHLPVKVNIQKGSKESRSYRISPEKAKKVLGFEPKRDVKEAVLEILSLLKEGKYIDFSNPIYYNIGWMKLLVDMEARLKTIGKVF